MARKFFNERINGSQKTMMQIIIIILSILGIIICFFVANHFLKNSNKNNNAILEIRDKVAIEINSNLPDKTLLFSKLENVKEDDIEVSFKNVDISKIGDYKVQIKVYGKEYETTLQVLDTISPELVLKDYTINENETYSLNDFVASCNDNSKESCDINYYDLTGIDYSIYKEPGEYRVQIVAKDSSNNTIVQEAILYIVSKDSNPPTPLSCKYGTSEYDKENNILAVDVTENGCGRDLNLYQSDVILSGVNKIMEQETEKIQKEFSKINVEGERVLYRTPSPVLNLTGNGVVGYTIKIEVYINNDANSELVESYYLDLTGKRIYSVNKYNLP